MIDKIYLVYWPSQFQELTVDWALKEICKNYNIQYESISYGPHQCDFSNINSNNEYSLIFFFYDPTRTDGQLQQIKDKCPNAKLIQLGGDFHYFGTDVSVLDKIYLHIDPMFKVQEKLRNLSIKYAHYYWSISEQFIQLIKKHEGWTEKTNDVICLCNINTGLRCNQFKRIAKQFSILTDLREFDINKVINYYKQSYISLGTSSPVLPCWADRSMKGFRDWMAPFCNTVLIYDDIDEIVALNNVVPIYKYDDDDSLLALIAEMKNDIDKRNWYILRQKEWALNNTIDKQFVRILTSNGIVL